MFGATKGVPIGAILYQDQLARAAEKIDIALTRSGGGRIVAVLDPYNPKGSTRFVNFITSKDVWKTGAQPPKSHISHGIRRQRVRRSRRRRVRSQHRRHPLERHGGHRRLVHRHRLQRGKLLRPPRLFSWCHDPYKSLKTALQAEIDEDAWATLYSDTSRPFPRPESKRIAVKVINHFGDEVMKVFRV